MKENRKALSWKQWGMIGVLCGCFIFIGIYGIRIFNPFYYTWCLSLDDCSLPFWGWLFYEKAAWKDSLIGFFDLTWPYELHAMFMDVVIPLNLPLKILCHWFMGKGVISQWIGLYGLSCYILHGFFSAMIFYKVTNSILIRFSGIVILCFSPYVLQRLFMHNTLAAQWILLAAMCLFLFAEELGRKRYILWILLTVIASSMHLYFAPMLAIMMGFALLADGISNKKFFLPIITYVSAFVFSILAVFLVGGFSTEIAEADQAWGYTVLYEYSANLNTLFNSDGYSLFLPALPRYDTEYEGFGYLGFGVITILFIDLFLLVKKFKRNGLQKVSAKQKVNFFCIASCAIVAFAIAISPRITLGQQELLIVSLPAWIKYWLCVFRSLGRFIWITDYIVIVTVIWLLETLSGEMKIKKIVSYVICVAAVVQILDLSPLINEKQEHFMEEVKWFTEMRNEKWKYLADTHDYVYPISARLTIGPSIKGNSMLMYVYENDLKITSTYFAHRNNDKFYEESLKYWNDILQGNAKKDVIYWFENEDYFNQAKAFMNCENIDGYYVGWVED